LPYVRINLTRVELETSYMNCCGIGQHMERPGRTWVFEFNIHGDLVIRSVYTDTGGYVHTYIHTYHSRFSPEGVAEVDGRLV
jgi:hypothetical protein